MGEVWEEAHLHSQKGIFQKPTLPVEYDALKFAALTSQWTEGGFQGWVPSQSLFEKWRHYQ